MLLYGLLTMFIGLAVFVSVVIDSAKKKEDYILLGISLQRLGLLLGILMSGVGFIVALFGLVENIAHYIAHLF